MGEIRGIYSAALGREEGLPRCRPNLHRYEIGEECVRPDSKRPAASDGNVVNIP
jgi:hypothetical protein